MKTKYLLFLTLFLFSACSNSSKPTASTEVFDYRMLEEEVVQESSYQQLISFNGIIGVNEDELYQYKAPEEGIVEQIYFSMGDFIKQGDRLLTFKSANYNELQNTLQANKKKVAIQQRALTSAKSLYDDQLLSHEEFLIAQSNLEIAEQELAQVQNTLALYGTPIANNLFEIKARQSGYVIQKDITPYLAVAKDESLLSIADLSNLWVKIQIHPTQIPLVKKDDLVQIHSSTYPNEVFIGRIMRLSPIIDPKDKVLYALIVVNNNELKLKPSMIVEVNVQRNESTQQIAIPTEALIFDENEQHVVTRTGEEYQIHQVKTAHTYHNSTFILEGIAKGDTIITKNNLLIYNHIKNRSN